MGSLRDLRSKPKPKRVVVPDNNVFYDVTDGISSALFGNGDNCITVTYDASAFYTSIELDETYEVDVNAGGSEYKVTIRQLKEIAKKAAESGLVDLSNLSP